MGSMGMKVLVDEKTGQRYEAINAVGYTEAYWVREIKEQKTVSWKDVADGVLVTWSFHDHDFHIKLNKELRNAVENTQGSVLRFSNESNVWRGGACPLPEGVMVDVGYRSGIETKELLASMMDWTYTLVTLPNSRDIIWYRVTGLAAGYVYPDEVIPQGFHRTKDRGSNNEF